MFPDSLVFRQPETNFVTRPHSSFRGIVDAVRNHRIANPALTRIHGWSTDHDQIAVEVDAYLAQSIHAMGPTWSHFIVEGSAEPPRPESSPLPATHQRRGLKSAVAVGSDTIISWLKSKDDAVPHEQANARAKVCSTCPQNQTGDWTTLFTRPVAEAIKAAVEQRRGWKLSTAYDDQLKTCVVCNCPLVLKQHMPLEAIRSKMQPEVWNALPPHCWMKKEAK